MTSRSNPPDELARIGVEVETLPKVLKGHLRLADAHEKLPFVPLSVPVHAVVMRLQGKFPRIRVERATEGDFAARSDDRSAAWEEEDQR